MLFFRGIEALQNEGSQSLDWRKVDLFEILKLMKDLIDYFTQPEDELGIFKNLYFKFFFDRFRKSSKSISCFAKQTRLISSGGCFEYDFGHDR